MKKRLRGLILDFDGTIAETERFGHRIAYNAAFAEFGLDWNWDEATYGELLSVAGGKERIRYYLARYRPGSFQDAVRSGLVVDLHRAKVRLFAGIATGIPFRPGVQRLVREVHAVGIPIAIATTAALAGVQAVLSQDSELSAMIALIAADDCVERKKPAPDVYEWTLEKLKLSPSSCIAIEDSHIGLQAALHAGLPTLITVSDYTAAEDFSGAAAVVSDLGSNARPLRSIVGPAPPTGMVDLAFLDSLVRRPSKRGPP
jgi:HAD superfamily hydrolase (TIGR01509 family)